MTALIILTWGVATAGLLIWLSLLLFRGFFWLARERDDALPSTPGDGWEWPAVVAVVPARDEASVIRRSLVSLLGQDYPGRFRIVLVDDQSSDGTAEIARDAAEAAAASGNKTILEVVSGSPPPPGWTGKLWSLNQGLARSESPPEAPPTYYLLTDADVVHARDHLRRLVLRAEGNGLVLVSTMVRLNCETLAERFLIPAFVFFFQMLYPFAWVNGRARTAAAAGGCMLVHRSALRASGGLAPISNAVIDDCTLARRLKRHGPIWLGLTDHAVSIRPYGGLSEIRAMVARSAYAQLGYSPVLLATVVLFMFVAYLAPPVLALLASGVPNAIGLVVWMTMALAMLPMLGFYGRSPLWGLVLPLIAAFYVVFTVDSALQYGRGWGGMWKGRLQTR